jgi:hypothetical protein
MSARARPTRFLIPPLISAGYLASIPLNPSSFKSCPTFSPIFFRKSRLLTERKGDIVKDRQRIEQRRTLEQHPEFALDLVEFHLV